MTEPHKDEGRKNDEGKLRYDLIPVGPLSELARVYTIGAAKYDDRNWEKGLAFSRLYAAMMRHANAFWRGEQCDQVDGQHHLSSVAWCAFAMMELEKTKPDCDDRPNPAKAMLEQFKKDVEEYAKSKENKRHRRRKGQ